MGRPKSLQALSHTTISEEDNSKYILVTLQKKFDQENPSTHELYNTAILAKIIQIVKLPNNTAKILIEAVARVKLSNIKGEEAFEANYKIIPDEEIFDVNNMRSLVDNAVQLFSKYAINDKKVNAEIIETINKKISNSTNFIDIINILASHLITSLEAKQHLLEETSPFKRITTVISMLTSNIVNSETEQALQQRVRKQIEKTQRDYYLHEQMKAIQKELDEDKSELADIEKKIKSLKLSKEAKEKAEAELKKLRTMNQMSAESGVTRNYLETLLSLPWGKYDNSKIDINQAEKILNRDHFGLEKVKERIIEYLAVLQRSSKIRGPILCLIGPPGVGKTSLVKSIAEGMGRKYTKLALGGVRDEAEIRGHRKTYLGSMPGKILGQLKKVKTSNPVMLLDEIDKMSSDFRGDPASALLEVLDPEQNSHFVDHYLEVEYDLSNVIFIATANSHDLPRALSDRMEKIYISGYVEETKLQIARNYLVPKQFKMHKIKKDEITISETAILDLIRYYTKESGVRALEREIGALTRKALKQILADKSVKHIAIDSNHLEEFLGAKKYNFGLAEKEDQIGSTTDLLTLK